MLRVRPFAALRPRPELAARVASVPYDVVDAAEARRFAAQEPLSFLRVVRPEVDLPESCDPYDPQVYSGARARLDGWVEDGTLLRESAPALYLYRQEMTLGSRRLSQVGVVGCCHVEDYREGRIKRHELTRPAKEDDRTRHVLACHANTGPVFLLHRDDAALAERVQADVAQAPLYDFEAPDGVRHSVWRVSEADPYVQAFARHGEAFVADGHHRSASAARAAMECADANSAHRGDEEYNWFLAVLFPASSLTVLPYHRVVQGLGGMQEGDFLEAVAKVATVRETDQPEPEAAGSIGMFVSGRWFRVTFERTSIDPNDPVASLDCALLGERILAPILGIEDVRTDPRVDFVGGIRGTGALQERVQSGRASVAFAMYPTSVEQLIAVAEEGKIMPPKSTWFEPKLRSGLLVHTL